MISQGKGEQEKAEPETRTLIIPREGDALCMAPGIEDFSSFPKRGKGRCWQDRRPHHPLLPSCTSLSWPNAATASARIWVAARRDENISTEERVCNVSAHVQLFHRRCQRGRGARCPGGSGAMARKPLDTAGFVGRRGITTTFVRSPAPELPLFHADQI